MSLEELFSQDIDEVFLDTEEFAKEHIVELEGETYTIPVVVNKNATAGLAKPLDGAYRSAMTIAFKAAAVARKPVRDQIMGFDGKEYLVVDCGDNMGLLVVQLGVPET